MGGSNVEKRITQADVARVAGISQALVSYVVNESTVPIPDETRRRIFAAMDQLGYVPNVVARRLRRGKTATIAGVIPNILNPFYPAFERGIQEVTDEQGYDLIIYNTDGKREKEQRCLQSLLQGRVDGVVGVFFHLSALELLPLLKYQIALVRLEATQKRGGELPIDNIFVNNVLAAKDAVRYLIEQGHKRIGMLSSLDGPAKFRLAGYQQALEEAGLEPEDTLIQHESFDENGGFRAMQKLLSARPTAIFAANDLMAMGAMMALREARLRIPEDVAVLGFDDIPAAKLVYPALSSVAQDQQALGRRAAEMVFERLSGTLTGPGRTQGVAHKLVLRDSA